MIGGVPTIAMQIIDHPDFESTTHRAWRTSPMAERRAARTGHTPSRSLSHGTAQQRIWTDRDIGRPRLKPRRRLRGEPSSCGPCYPVNEVAVVPEEYEGDDPGDELPRGPTSWESCG